MKRVCPLLLVAAFSLLLTSCFDTKNPLSDPQKSKPDDRLSGVWRFRGDSGEINYYHFGPVGGEPPGVHHAGRQCPAHAADRTMQSGQLLVFPTTIGDKTYLNVADTTPSQLTLLEEKGWTDEAIKEYVLLRYQITGDTLSIQWMDSDARNEPSKRARSRA